MNIKKWMRVAKSITEVESPCYSRDIGAIIVDPLTDSLVSAGHNGPPGSLPPCDDKDYLQNVVWPQLTADEKKMIGMLDGSKFAERYANCQQCPRKHINAPSGKRLELCVCRHGEQSAILNAHRSVVGCWMFCWCKVPCIDCTKAIIDAGIHTVIALAGDLPDDGSADYSPYSSRWMFKNSNINLRLVTNDWVLENGG